MSTRSSGLSYKETCAPAWQQLWHQILGSAGASLESQGQGLRPLGHYLWHMPRQAWRAASNTLSNHVSGRWVQSTAHSRVHAYAAVLYQGVNQVLVSLLRVKGVMQAMVAQASDKTGRLEGRQGWRILASSDDNGVDIDVTVDVPSGQDGPAAQNSIEGPSFAPTLQQSLSNQGAKHQHSAEIALCMSLPCCTQQAICLQGTHQACNATVTQPPMWSLQFHIALLLAINESYQQANIFKSTSSSAK